MEVLDLKQMGALARIIAEEKNLEEAEVISVIEQAIAAAWRRDYGEREMNVRAELDLNSGEATAFIMRTVVANDEGDEEGHPFNPDTEITLADAKKTKKSAELGDIIEEAHKVGELGRVASQTAKQVLVAKLRELEREKMLALFEDKIGEVIQATVSRVDRAVRVDLGRATAIMPEREQIPGERYRVGSRIKVYLKGVERGERGADLIVSRAAAEFVEYLFRQEVPELENGLVEIKAIAREAGRRTKIAVAAGSAGVDPVGTLVGGRGVRVQAVQSEIGDREKIDVVIWSDNMPEFIREALSPAEIMRVELDNENRRAKVYVAEDQQPIAIGKQGQNVRLASRLTGYELDIELDQKPKAVKKTSRGAEDSLISAIEDIAE
ncbi:MAG: transcription termination factor NusA [Candidatus Nomurabacteria bacterium]|jgi:N utilization substance protein A|nr:transcription termination factor NusA [Candidatus Nomurabacteria bacterium]